MIREKCKLRFHTKRSKINHHRMHLTYAWTQWQGKSKEETFFSKSGQEDWRGSRCNEGGKDKRKKLSKCGAELLVNLSLSLKLQIVLTKMWGPLSLRTSLKTNFKWKQIRNFLNWNLMFMLNPYEPTRYNQWFPFQTPFIIKSQNPIKLMRLVWNVTHLK